MWGSTFSRRTQLRLKPRYVFFLYFYFFYTTCSFLKRPTKMWPTMGQFFSSRGAELETCGLEPRYVFFLYFYFFYTTCSFLKRPTKMRPTMGHLVSSLMKTHLTTSTIANPSRPFSTLVMILYIPCR